MAERDMLTAEYVRQILHYDPETGIFTRRYKSQKTPAGGILGTPREDGYLIFRIGKFVYRTHRVAWLYMTGVWPKNTIDHVNLNRSDNRWCNLREATWSQNNANRGSDIRNKTGIKGVGLSRSGKKFIANIRRRGTNKYLGTFDCPAAAHFAYLIEAHKEFGEYSRARR